MRVWKIKDLEEELGHAVRRAVNGEDNQSRMLHEIDWILNKFRRKNGYGIPYPEKNEE